MGVDFIRIVFCDCLVFLTFSIMMFCGEGSESCFVPLCFSATGSCELLFSAVRSVSGFYFFVFIFKVLFAACKSDLSYSGLFLGLDGNPLFFFLLWIQVGFMCA